MKKIFSAEQLFLFVFAAVALIIVLNGCKNIGMASETATAYGGCGSSADCNGCDYCQRLPPLRGHCEAKKVPTCKTCNRETGQMENLQDCTSCGTGYGVCISGGCDQCEKKTYSDELCVFAYNDNLARLLLLNEMAHYQPPNKCGGLCYPQITYRSGVSCLFGRCCVKYKLKCDHSRC